MAFDAGYLLTRVILLAPTTADTDRANPIFLRLLKQAERFFSSPLAATFRYLQNRAKNIIQINNSWFSLLLGLL